MKLFQKLTIIGVGLLGASLAKACKGRGLIDEITGYGRNRENLKKAKDLKVESKKQEKKKEDPKKKK